MWSPFRAKYKVIEHNVGDEVKIPDDPSYPYKIEVRCAHPELHKVAKTNMYGPDEYLIMRVASRKAMVQYIDEAGLRTHPLLNSCVVTGPDGEIERFGRHAR
jgi:hypothetical protein